MLVPPIITLAAIMCGSAIVISAMSLVSRHIALRRMTSESLSNEEIARRLERIEQAIDATAIEVERLAEAGRFVTKLLAQKGEAAQSQVTNYDRA